MDNFIIYLKSKLSLHDFTLVKTTSSKLVIFKCFNKYTKCIYVNFLDDSIEIRIDKVFDSKFIYCGIERLIISNKVFHNIDDSINYINRNIVI